MSTRPRLGGAEAVLTETRHKDAARPEDVPDDAFVRVFRVPPEAAGTRLDVFLSAQLRNTSRTRAKLIATHGVYTIDGRRLRPSDRLRAEDHIALWRAPFDEADEPVDIPVLHADDHLLVIDKPPLMAVHPTARHHHVTVIKLLEHRYPDEPLSLIHRLDRETSGVLLVARTSEANRAFKRLFESRSTTGAGSADEQRRRAAASPVRKIYHALTWGAPPSGIIDLPVEPDPGSPLRVKMRIARPGLGLEARTKVEVIERRSRYALVECELYTGRQHQIRVHLAAIGYPTVGDKLYGPDDRLLARAADRQLSAEDLAVLELPRHALHAHRYELPHAVTGEPLCLESPLPRDLRDFWNRAPH